MGRAFYRLSLAAWDATDAEGRALRPGECIEVSRSSTVVYLLSATDPNQAIYDAGGERLGARLSEVDSTARKHFTQILVERVIEEVDGSTRTERFLVPSMAVKRTDTVIGPPIPRALFAGDDPADLL